MGKMEYITDEVRDQMVRMYIDGVPVRVIAGELHVSYSTVYSTIVNNRRRKASIKFSSYSDVKTLSDHIERTEAEPRRLLINPKSRVNNFC